MEGRFGGFGVVVFGPGKAVFGGGTADLGGEGVGSGEIHDQPFFGLDDTGPDDALRIPGSVAAGLQYRFGIGRPRAGRFGGGGTADDGGGAEGVEVEYPGAVVGYIDAGNIGPLFGIGNFAAGEDGFALGGVPASAVVGGGIADADEAGPGAKAVAEHMKLAFMEKNCAGVDVFGVPLAG